MASSNGKAKSHYNDWPNTQGFDVRYQELEPKELEVEGTIPAYAAGVLFRNGLGPRDVETEKGTSYRVSHWFDSFSQVHRFQIHPPSAEYPSVRVTHNSRLTSDGLVERIKKNGSLTDFTFGAKRDPCMSVFQKMQSFFKPMPRQPSNNVNVSVSLSVNFPGFSATGTKSEAGIAQDNGSSSIATLCNKTDASMMQFLDPQTLEPIGVTNQKTLHPDLAGPLSAAHANRDPTTGDVFNYNLDPRGKLGTYRVFTVSAATGKVSVLATIKHPAAYLHSMFLTEHYAILCVWSAFFSMGGLSMLWHRNFAEAFADFDPSIPVTWFVVDRTPLENGGKGLVAKFESEPFFCFHSINAYEEVDSEGKTDIVADLCAYSGGLDIIKRFYIDNLLSDSPTAPAYCDPVNKKAHCHYARFRLPGLSSSSSSSVVTAGQAVLEHKGEIGLAPELPSINESYRQRKHRYVYGVTDSGKSSFMDGLVKYDLETGACVRWCHRGQTAGEPIFVADPERSPEVEDAGVLLSVVLDGIGGESYLLVLDAQSMEEVGRGRVGGVVGFGFHGVHVPEGKEEGEDAGEHPSRL